ncbi:hypothetical protein AWH51_09395 [Clavibacter tessellarius]|uniref:Uncharacterized protein n=1 Tax=Clavibacter tessellarius TaxID=31965 RepID=A0A154V1D1_9MICO|nr:hypothetical protein AWH51_09395 [Clavibacter michiganensis subsp. tessellarius]
MYLTIVALGFRSLCQDANVELVMISSRASCGSIFSGGSRGWPFAFWRNQLAVVLFQTPVEPIFGAVLEGLDWVVDVLELVTQFHITPPRAWLVGDAILRGARYARLFELTFRLA